jgi:uncharacterized protein YkwD
MIRRVTTLFFVICIFLVSASLAHADTLTLHLTNSAGVELDGAYITTPASTSTTDAHGDATVNVSAGQTITISRTNATGNCADPDARSYTVPDPVPSTIDITLPVLLPNGPHDYVTSDDRYLVGLINHLRAQHGLAPLVISTYLTNDADNYAAIMPTNPYSSKAQSNCDAGDDYSRVVDGGGQLLDEGQIETTGLVSNPTAEEFFNGTEVYNEQFLLSTDADAVGVAQENNNWVLLMGQCLASEPSICGMNGDTGSLNATHHTNDGSSSPSGPATPQHSYTHANKLRISRIAYRHGAIYFTVAVAQGAKGHLSVSAYSGKHQAHLLHHKQTYRFTVAHTGQWHLTARFLGRSGWQTSAVYHTVNFS